MINIESISSIYLYETNRKTWSNPNKSKYYNISYQLSGHYDHTFNRKILEVKADSLFLIPKGAPYSVQRRSQGRAICMTFAAELDLPPTVIDCKANPEILKLFKKLLNYKNLQNEYNYCEAMATAYKLVGFILKTNKNEYVGHDARSKIESAVADIAENYTAPFIDVSELAKKHSMSAKYFRTLFKKLYNVTPTQYIISLRLQTAVKLLNESNMSIGEIAELSGFSDLYYFSKIFKAKFGLSPKEYRRQNSE